MGGPRDSSQADSSHQEWGYTHSAQPGLGRGPSCQVSAGTGTLVSRKLSPWGRGARGPPSKTNSGFLCTVSTGGRREESREDKNRHSSGRLHVLTQTGLLRPGHHDEDDDKRPGCTLEQGVGRSLPHSRPALGRLPPTTGLVYNVSSLQTARKSFPVGLEALGSGEGDAALAVAGNPLAGFGRHKSPLPHRDQMSAGDRCLGLLPSGKAHSVLGAVPQQL